MGFPIPVVRHFSSAHALCRLGSDFIAVFKRVLSQHTFILYSLQSLSSSKETNNPTQQKNKSHQPPLQERKKKRYHQMFDYRRLVPGGDGSEHPEQQQQDIPTDFGVYEDEESRAARNPFYFGESGFTCPVWITDRMPELSLKERILGCVVCMACGYLMGIGSFIRLTQVFRGNPVPLVVRVTLGNILSLCGTCFLTGPQQQARRMFHKSRKIASMMYLGGIGLTLILLFMPPFPTRGFLLILLLLGQYAAITWYCLSYIPFARDIVKRFCRRFISSSDADDDY